MKKIFLLLLLFSAYLVNAQDIIIKKDGLGIDAKIEEISKETIKYKDFDNLDGPSYVIMKTDVTIIYHQNGEIENFEQIINKEKDETYQKYLSAKKRRNMGTVFIVVGSTEIIIGSCLVAVAGIYSNFGEVYSDRITGMVIGGTCLTVMGTGFLIGGIVNAIVGSVRMRLNSDFTLLETDNLKLDMSMHGNGVGLKLKF